MGPRPRRGTRETSPSHAYNQRRDELFGRCDRLGRVDLHDLGEQKRVRQLVIDVIIPGQEGGSRLPDEAHFRYQEWWRRSSVGWARFRHDYDDGSTTVE